MTEKMKELKRGEASMPLGALDPSDVMDKENCSVRTINSSNGADREEQCHNVKCLFGLEHLPCDYDYIAYDENCTFNIRLPISRNLQEVYLSNVLYPEYGVGLLWSRTWNRLRALDTGPQDDLPKLRTCYQPNKLRKIDASFENILFSSFVTRAGDPYLYYKQ